MGQVIGRVDKPLTTALGEIEKILKSLAKLLEMMKLLGLAAVAAGVRMPPRSRRSALVRRLRTARIHSTTNVSLSDGHDNVRSPRRRWAWPPPRVPRRRSTATRSGASLSKARRRPQCAPTSYTESIDSRLVLTRISVSSFPVSPIGDDGECSGEPVTARVRVGSLDRPRLDTRLTHSLEIQIRLAQMMPSSGAGARARRAMCGAPSLE